MNKSPLDAGIPLLTEIIEELPQAPAAAPEPAPAPEVPPQPAAEQPHIHNWIDEEWTRLEHRISERVLEQMLDRIDFVLEQRIRDSLADVLQVAVSGLATEIRSGLQQTLEEVIGRAVSQEITRLQNTKKQIRE